MPKDQKQTEQKIFEAASRVFKKKGYAGARMQEIADEADINKSMLHYYFRSKDQLFQKIYQREMIRVFPVIFGVLGSALPLEEKLEQLIEAYYSFLNDNPSLIQFVLHEMNQHPERFKNFIKEQGIRPPQAFHDQIQQEIKKGNMDCIQPEQLLISIVGLILFPFIARTMVESLFDLDDEDFKGFLEERKAMLTDFILNAINYKRQ